MTAVSTCKTDRSYNYVVVHGVHTAPPVAAGMRVALSYCEATIEYAIDFVRTNHPGIAIESVTNFTGA